MCKIFLLRWASAVTDCMDSETQKVSDICWKTDLNSSPELVSCSLDLYPFVLFSLLLCSLTYRQTETLSLSLRFDTNTEIYVGTEQKENTSLCEIFHLFTK